MSIVIPLPWPRPPLTGNRTRGNPHARAAEVKRAKAEAFAAVLSERIEPIVAADVTLHFRPATRHRRDSDGMFPTLKVVLDALVMANVLPDDSWVHVPQAACRIHPPFADAEMWVELDAIHPYDEGVTP